MCRLIQTSQKLTKLYTQRIGNLNQINNCGTYAASCYPDLIYWGHNWRLNNGNKRMYEIAKRENFYKQKYCGCVYSLHDQTSDICKENYN